MKLQNLMQAINNLNPTAEVSATDIDNITWHVGTPTPKADLEAEVSRIETEYDAQAYARTRQPLYPDIGDQLDDLYHKGAFSTEMAAKIKKVKDDNPKG